MVNRLIIFIAIILTAHLGKGEIISLSGVYEGINLYVENDPSQTCMREIFVNDQRIDFARTEHFFEIDMSFLKLKENVTVKIICEPGCHAKILNPEAINLMYGFQFMTINLELNKIEWTTTNEKAGGKYIVEVHVHKQWVAIGEVMGKTGKVVGTYEKKIEVMKHQYYRIKYLDKEGVPHSSKPVKYHKHKK